MFQPPLIALTSYFMLMCNPFTCYSMMAVQWGHSSKQSKMCPAKRNHFISRRMTHLYSFKELEMHNTTLSQTLLSFSLPSVKPITYSIPSQHQKLLFNSNANFPPFLPSHYSLTPSLSIGVELSLIWVQAIHIPLGILQSILCSFFFFQSMKNTQRKMFSFSVCFLILSIFIAKFSIIGFAIL